MEQATFMRLLENGRPKQELGTSYVCNSSNDRDGALQSPTRQDGETVVM